MADETLPLDFVWVSKPQYVEAIRWMGDNWDEVRAALPGKVLLDYTYSYLPSDKPWDQRPHNGMMVVAGKDGAQGEVPVPVGHWLVHPPGDLSDVWPVENDYFRTKYERPAIDGDPPLHARGREEADRG